MDVFSTVAIPAAITTSGLIVVAIGNGFFRWIKDKHKDSIESRSELIEGAAELRSQLQKENEALRDETRKLRAELLTIQAEYNKAVNDLAAANREAKWSSDERDRLKAENFTLTNKIIAMVK
jgi:septal ring factor EnvC (AmiA/AmiB activator)